MDAVLIAACWLVSTVSVVLVCRRRWAHSRAVERCAECAWRHRETHPTGRHRANRLALPAAPGRPVDPDATSPALPVLPAPYGRGPGPVR